MSYGGAADHLTIEAIDASLHNAMLGLEASKVEASPLAYEPQQGFIHRAQRRCTRPFVRAVYAEGKSLCPECGIYVTP